ncbi:uncharacterized protein LOC126664935 [Mercurialis annua]|uniref:uncharacterized protein LOC126664935 n=1 Tax=Mercurialis annua TaxID=3986 RepID=UPI00215F1FA3|nr:uncharacterized protein LOC126664935 [Mercurialis annua]
MNQLGLWKKLWRCWIQPKIRYFVWRICHGTLPCSDNLMKRPVPVLNHCPWCVSEKETDLHALSECEEVRGLWLLSLQGLRVRDYQIPSMVDWLNIMFSAPKNEKIQNFITSIGGRESQLDRSPRLLEVYSWQAPPRNTIKINFDVVVAAHKILSVAAAVCRNDLGVVIKYGVSMFHGVVDAKLDEAQTVLFGLQLAEQFSEHMLVVEFDALLLIVDDCMDIVKDRVVVFQHIHRNDNVVTHALPKCGIFYGRSRIFDGEISFSVNKLVTDVP